MSNKIKILDFDGFLTDEIKEAEPFTQKFLELYSTESGIPLKEVHTLFDQTKAMITRNEGAGFIYKGKIVAPATSSQYLFYQVVAQKINSRFDEYAAQYGKNIDKMNVDKLVEIYLKSYPASGVAFKEGAKDFLEKHSDAVIVTNSKTDKVKEKLESIGINNIRLYGNAQKLEVTTQIEEIPETVEQYLGKEKSRGIPRQIYLWRGKYNTILNEIVGENKDVTVLGDVWELDNTVPLMKGYKTITLDNYSNNGTIGLKQYERDLIPTLNNSYIVKNLEEAGKYL